MKCTNCGGERVKKYGTFKNRNGVVQRYGCCNCGKTFSLSNNNGMRVAKAKIELALRLLCESSGIRATSRLTGLHQATVLKVLKIAGQLARLHENAKARDLKPEVVQVDELYAFVGCKEHNNLGGDDSLGSQYTFLAVDARSKFIISSITGRRSEENAMLFFQELKRRVPGRFQINTDAWLAYSGRDNAIRRVFGKDGLDHVVERKLFKQYGQFVSKSLAKVKRHARMGAPDLLRGSTSFVERTNLTLRQFNRRFVRLTLGFSKKLLNLRYSVSLFKWHFNFARTHKTLGSTPAVALGVASESMTVNQLWDYEVETI